MSTNTETRGNSPRSKVGAIVTLMCLLVASSGAAHVKARTGSREIVRLQGYREVLPPDLKAQREVVLSILGEDHKFYVTDWRRFSLTDEELPGETERSRFALQAERAVLVKIAGARPEQRVTILGERRPNGSDIFVLAFDLCPSE